MNPECPKCGARMVGPFYERACVAPRHPEYLRYSCRCGFEIKRPTKDALVSGTPTERTPQP